MGYDIIPMLQSNIASRGIPEESDQRELGNIRWWVNAALSESGINRPFDKGAWACVLLGMIDSGISLFDGVYENLIWNVSFFFEKKIVSIIVENVLSGYSFCVRLYIVLFANYSFSSALCEIYRCVNFTMSYAKYCIIFSECMKLEIYMIRPEKIRYFANIYMRKSSFRVM